MGVRVWADRLLIGDTHVAGDEPPAQRDRLGDGAVALTLDVYSHAVPAMEDEEPSRIAALVTG